MDNQPSISCGFVETMHLYVSHRRYGRPYGITYTEVFSFNPAPPSMKGYDAIGEDGIRYEIKARRLTPRSKPTRFSAIRSFDEGSFDKLVAILFNEDFSVNRAFIFPRDYIQEKAYWQEHVNGWILPINDSLWDEKFGQDITKKLQKHQTLSVA